MAPEIIPSGGHVAHIISMSKERTENNSPHARKTRGRTEDGRLLFIELIKRKDVSKRAFVWWWRRHVATALCTGVPETQSIKSLGATSVMCWK